MRENYTAGTLRRAALSDDPFTQFSIWFDDAVAAKIREPNAMTLSTIGANGVPTARTVLLKQLDSGSGFGFFTNYESRKGNELAANPVASGLFFWKELERQVHFRGKVEKLNKADSEAYFFSRPYGSRIGAWVSKQSRTIENREWLEQRDAEFRERFPDTGEPDSVPLPEFWGGYRIIPSYFEFWQGQPSRLHDRFSYEKADDTPDWSIRRLSP
ncbi:UNVERIFIED_CONTAM: hypothetical protein GTU68_004604 [Idotea baltica]|nr:hypothetical protein [Idotea baltica]